MPVMPTRLLTLAVALTLALAACSRLGGGADPATEVAAPAVPNLTPDSRGVITYATYQVAVARDGDTLESIAARVGTTANAISTANALPPDYRLRTGEVLLLPDSVPRPSAGLDTGTISSQPLEWSPEAAAAAIDGGTAAQPPAAGNPFGAGQTDPLIDPIRHRVESGETAYSIARLYGVSVTALASWNGLGPDLAVRENQELLIPIVSDANRISAASDDEAPGELTPVPPPAIATEPLPQDITTATAPASPGLGQTRTPPGGRLTPPVSAGVARGYDPANPNGVGYDVPAGTAVQAAADGEVALISEELGGIGTIVLIRHQDDLMTTYSTLSDVTVTKGERVRAGQTIGRVAPRDDPELQFDVFRGTSSVDPAPYIGG
jgi:lipoprotein NlpD